ncbi:protein phosphatase 2C domain-containing protein [Geomonas paludis]|uniref:Protein phosphatase 2C domain-containing protein n=1 Tax=Geomonas paludis TaxID=2740185 RepID=A0ABY4LHM9_9BACT|nr:PP2C family serine/threonine-protein phosphatase [Geomonas paludis]UPU37503.1 protein phosphatase 2C domain-containing protein [Geomonas paludis]
MPDARWDHWGGSVIGPLHVRTGLPNQDAWMARRYRWGSVVVVSDGLGSKPNSDVGSKAACLAVFEAARSFAGNQRADLEDVLRLIHAHWLVKIAPFFPSDCSATCLFAMLIDGTVTLGRLGDGMIAVQGASEGDSCILSDDKEQSFSNYTSSLHHEFRPRQWETATIDSARCEAVVLCTDGISDDLLPEMRMPFAQELCRNYAAMDPDERRQDLRRWLGGWPVPGHSDDKTIACLFKRGVAR